MTMIKTIRCDNCGLFYDFLNATGYEKALEDWTKMDGKDFCSEICLVEYLNKKETK